MTPLVLIMNLMGHPLETWALFRETVLSRRGQLGQFVARVLGRPLINFSVGLQPQWNQAGESRATGMPLSDRSTFPPIQVRSMNTLH